MASFRHRSFHRHLIATTALVGVSMFAPSAAQAQALPDTANVSIQTGGATAGGEVPMFDTSVANTLTVNLRDNQTIINYLNTGTGFNVASGNTVNFRDDRANTAVTLTGGTDNIAVLNRDLSGTPSTIAGMIASDANVSVYLVNSNGIMFGAGSVINTGSFVASTLNLIDASFLSGSATLQFTGTGPNAISITGAPSFTTTGAGTGTGIRTGDLVFLGAQITSAAGSTFTASGDLAFVAAEDIQVTSAVGSPMSFVIASGSAVNSALKLNGTYNGRNVTIALATRGAVADSLLGINGVITATGVTMTDRGIVLTAGATAPGVTLTPTTAADIDTVGSITVTDALNATRGSAVYAADNVSFATALTLTGATTATSINGTVAFTSTVDGAQALTTNGATTFGGTVGGTSPLTSLTVNGTSAINGGAITTTGAQSYTGAVTLGGTTTLSSTGGGAISFSSTVDSDATARALTVNTAGTTMFGGLVGDTNALVSLTTDAAGTTAINGGLGTNNRTIRTTGAQAFNDAVTLGANTSLTGGAIGFGNTANGAFALTTAGATTFGGTVNIASLGVTGTTAINTSSITTSGAQDYTGAVTLAVDTTLMGSAIQFNGAGSMINGGQALALNGATKFDGTVQIDSLEVTGTTAINTSSIFAITGALNFTGAVTLGANTSLTGTSIGFGSTVDGAFGLVTAGETTFGGRVGNTTALVSIDVNGTAAINTDVVRTTDLQNYTDAVTLGSNAVLTSTATGSISFDASVDSDATARALTVNTAGLTTFTGLVGDTNALLSLTTDAGGTTAINGGLGANNRTVRTTQTQTYNDAVTLGANTLLLSSGTGALGNVTFATTVDSEATARALTVNTAGTTTFGGLVGDTNELASLTTDAAGTSAINGGGVTTTGIQSYSDAITLGATTTLSVGTALTATSIGGASGLTITADTATLDTVALTAGSISITATNAVMVDSLSATAAGADVTVSGSSLANRAGTGAMVITAGDDLSAIATTGAARLGALTATAGNVNVMAGTTATVASILAGTTATVTAGTLARVDGNVTAGGDYIVTGGSVTLGTTAAALQRAAGAVTITALTGGISGLNTLTLQSSSDNAGAERLTLSAATSIDFASGTSLLGGTTRTALVELHADDTSALSLGNVSALGVVYATGAGAAVNGINRAGTLTVGTVNLVNAIDFNTGAISAGLLSSGAAVSLISSADIATANIAAGGNVTITAGATATITPTTVADAINATGSIDLSATSATVGGRIQAGGFAHLRATTGSLGVQDVAATTDVTLRAAATSLSFGAVTGNGVTVTADANSVAVGGAGASVNSTGAASFVGGTINLGGTVQSVGALSADSTSTMQFVSLASTGSSVSVGTVTTPTMLTVDNAVSAATNITLRAGSLMLGSVSAPSAAPNGVVSITATSGSATITGAATAGNGLSIDAQTGINIGGLITVSAGTLSLTTATGNLTLASITAPSIALTATTGEVSVSGDVTAGAGDYNVTGNTISLGGSTAAVQTATGAIALNATGAAAGVGIRSTGTLTLRSNSANSAGAAATSGITLTTGAGSIALGSTALQASTTNLSAVTIAATPASADVSLGDVSALSLDGLNARAGAITTGNIDVAQPTLTIGTSSGNVSTGTITNTGTIALTASAGSIGTGNLTSTTADVTADAATGIGTGDVSATGLVSLITTGGNVIGGAIGGGSVVGRGPGGVSISSLMSGSTADVTSTAGAVTITTDAIATGALQIDAFNALSARDLRGASVTANARSMTLRDVTSTTGALALTATNDTTGMPADITVRDVVAASTGMITTAGAFGGSIGFNTALATNNLTLDAVVNVRGVSATSSSGSVVVTALGAISGPAGAAVNDGRLDPNFGRLVVSAATGFAVNGGSLAQLGSLTRGGSGAATVIADQVDIESPVIDIDSVTARTGTARIRALSGIFKVGTVTTGTSARLVSDDPAQDIVIGTVSAGNFATAGDVTVTSARAVRIDSIATLTGGITITAPGAVTGRALGMAATDGRPDLNFGRITLAAAPNATGAIDVNAAMPGGLVQIASATGGSIAVSSLGIVDILGDVTANGDLSVRGSALTLGAAGGVTQRATGSVRYVSTAGSITAGTGMMVIANSDDVVENGSSITIDATGGNIAFGPTTTLLGGASNRQSNIGIRLGTSGSALTLGTVRGRTLSGVDAAGTTFGDLTTTGAITLGDVSVRNALTVGTTGLLSSGPVFVTGAGQSLSLQATSGITATGTLSSQGNLSIDTDGNLGFTTAVSNAGNASVRVGGNAAGSLLQAFGSVSEIVTGADTIATTRSGEPAMFAADPVGGGNSGGLYPVPNPTPPGSTPPLDSNLTISAGSITKSTVSAGAALSVTATSGLLQINSATAGTTATFAKQGTIDDLQLGTATAGNAVTIGSTTDARLGVITSQTAAVAVTSTGATTGLMRGTALADGRADANFDFADLIAATTVNVTAGPLAQLGRVDHGTTSTADVIADRVDVRADAVDLTTATARATALTITARIGDLRLGTGTAMTSISLDKQVAASPTAPTSVLRATSLTAGTSVGVMSRTDALLDTVTSGTATTVSADRLASVTGAVSAGGNYSVTGASVALGDDADAEIQSAGGAVAIRSTGGAITGGVGLTLRSNSGGAADAANTRALTIDATGGAISFDIGSNVQGGTQRQSLFGVAARTAGSAITLGNVSAQGFTGINPALTTPLTNAGDILIGTLGTTEAIAITSTAGSIRLGDGASTAGGITLMANAAVTGLARTAAATDGRLVPLFDRASLTAASGNDVAITAGTTAQIGSVTAGRNITGTAQAMDASSLTATTGSITGTASVGDLIIGTAAAGTTATLTKNGAASGELQIGTLTSGNATGSTGVATLTSATAARLGSITSRTSDIIVTAGGPVTGTALASAATDGRLAAGFGTANLNAANDLRVTASSTTAPNGAALQLGTVSAVRSIALNAANADLLGSVTAPDVTITYGSGTGALRLGTDANGTGGFVLDLNEINRIQAARVVFDAVGRNVAIGAVGFNAGIGTQRIDIRSTAAIRLDGLVTLTGANRTLRIGDLAATPSATSSVSVFVTAGAGGRINLSDGDLVLNAGRVAVGQNDGFISVLSTLSAQEVATRYVANSNSSLYSAQLAGGVPYTAFDLIIARNLSVAYTDYAVFQNTGFGTQTLGVTVGSLSAPQLLGLTSTGASAQNGFALFGSINGTTGSASALLGPSAIGITGLNLAQSRINGCLIASGGGGCLISAISIPTSTVFDVRVSTILQAVDDLAISFDPLIGTNNESLFADLGTADILTDETQAPTKPDNDAPEADEAATGKKDQ